jgi:hypothetical protein
MGLLARLFGRPARELPPLLSARVLVADDDTYGVRIDRLNDHLAGSEYLRLVLHYYAQVLFRCAASPGPWPAVGDNLQSIMRRVAVALSDAAPEPLTEAGLDELTIKDPAQVPATREIRATLLLDRISRRQLTAEFMGDLAASEAAASVFVVIRECLRHLGDDERAELGRALLSMDQMYGAGYRSSDRENASHVPNEVMGL